MCFSQLNIGQVLTPSQMAAVFDVKSLKNSRFLKDHNTLVLISDLSQTQHPDKWIGDTLHFAGAGTVGDQKITGLTNSKLADSRTNGVQIILFQVFQPKQFVYCGPVKMAGDPYTVTQPDKNGLDRLVWVFPIQLTHAQPIPKVGELVFADGEDYNNRGTQSILDFVRRRDHYRGCRLCHPEHGAGTVVDFNGTIITVRFDNKQTKTYNFKQSVGGGYLQFVS